MRRVVEADGSWREVQGLGARYAGVVPTKG